jgi:prepilin signal peptidase PulO-like enzyme (type II secretory pathway)
MPLISAESVLSVALGAYAVIVASLLGSFFNLAGDRLPRGESLVRPRSHCISCGRVLNLVDLIPVAGFVIRRGRCAGCGVPIGVSSPLVEGACAAAMLAAVGLWGLFPGAAVGLAAVSLIGVGWVLRNLAFSPAGHESRSG